jgi:hypothetical protein
LIIVRRDIDTTNTRKEYNDVELIRKIEEFSLFNPEIIVM